MNSTNMKIDRHNYEEFFILYWDNELSAVQRQAVENFVKENTDLREEFKILGETRFAPDATLQFNEKDFLVNDSFINITNYEEQLLNYIDDEVTAGERKDIEKFVSLNPVAQRELTLLQKTKLKPDVETAFFDKSVLYRKEEKPVRIFSLTWFRVAVAAALVLIAGFTTFQIVSSDKNIATVAAVENPNNNRTENKVIVPKEQSTIQSQPDIAGTKQEPGNKTEKEDVLNKDDQKKADENLIALTTTQPENKNNLPKPARIDHNEIIPAEVNTDLTLVELDKVDKMHPTQTMAINSSLRNSDVTNKPELALYIPEAEAKEKDGGGLKEFLRKTTRVLERRTKIQTTTEDNKLLVGAFAVSLK